MIFLYVTEQNQKGYKSEKRFKKVNWTWWLIGLGWGLVKATKENTRVADLQNCLGGMPFTEIGNSISGEDYELNFGHGEFNSTFETSTQRCPTGN